MVGGVEYMADVMMDAAAGKTIEQSCLLSSMAFYIMALAVFAGEIWIIIH